MLIPRPEIAALFEAFDRVSGEGVGTTVFVTGEPGIGKSTLVEEFLRNCDSRSGRNVLTAVGRCTDVDGTSTGYLPWKQVLVELDVDRAAGGDPEKREGLKTILRTLFDESGGEWIQNIPQIGDISAAILDTAKAIRHAETLDVTTGETRELSFRERVRHVVEECTGSWLGAIPVVGGLAEAVFETSRVLARGRGNVNLQSQEDFFLLVMRRLRALAGESPVVVFLDDLQWADASSLSLLLYLAKNLHDEPYPLLLIGTYRPEDVRRVRRSVAEDEVVRHPLEEKLNVLRRYDAAREIAVGRFDRSHVEEYLRIRLEDHALPDAFVDELHHVTNGNALFIQEMVTNMIERGILARRDGQWRALDAVDYRQLPTTVEGVIRERYERLGEELREVLMVAAVEGEEFAIEIIESILQENRIRLHRKLDRLLNTHDLIRRSSRAYEKLNGIYEFTHNLVQRYIYHTIDVGFRNDLHTVIAETMRMLLSPDQLRPWEARYAYHLGVGSGIIDEHRAVLAAERSEAWRAEHAQALAEFLRVERGLAADAMSNFNHAEALRLCEEVLDVAQAIGDMETVVEFHRRMSVIHLRTGDVDSAAIHDHAVVGLAEKFDRADWRMFGHHNLAFVSMHRGYHDDALNHLDIAYAAAEQVDRGDKMAHVLENMGEIDRERGEFDRALERFSLALEMYQAMDDDRGILSAVGNMGNVLAGRGEYEAALDCYRRSLTLSRKHGYRSTEVIALGHIGVAHLRVGRDEEAMASFLAQLELGRAIADPVSSALAVGNMAEVHRRQGNVGDALRCLRRALQEHGSIGYAQGTVDWHGRIAELLLDVLARNESADDVSDDVSEVVTVQEGEAFNHAVLRTAVEHTAECEALAARLSKREALQQTRMLRERIDALGTAG